MSDQFPHVSFPEIQALAHDVAPRAFLIGIDRSVFNRPVVTIHSVRDRTDRVDTAALRARFRREGVGASCRVRRHRAGRLERARSLEGFLKGFRHQEIVCDPTGSFERASALVAFAAELRKSGDQRVSGLYWHSAMRTIYVVLDHKAFVAERKVKVSDLAEIERGVAQALEDAGVGEYVPGIRLGFELPDLPLVPIDERSYVNRGGLLKAIRKYGAGPAFGAVLGLGVSGAALAADPDPGPPGSDPAVSEPNGKLSIHGGFWDENNFGTDAAGKLNGSFSIPLGHQFGFQGDGWVGLSDDRTFGGLGAHLFWRDPNIGLLGVIGSASFMEFDGAPNEDMGRIGGEGELYLDQFSLLARAGYQFGDNIDNGFFGSAELRWYISPDFLVNVGGVYDEEREGMAKVGVEFQPGLAGLPGLSLFADGAFGDNDLAQVFFGIRYYFGSPKSLQDRHRRDDPGNLDDSNTYVSNYY